MALLRLRVRSGPRTERVQVPRQSTLDELKQQVAAALRLPAAFDVSLNNRSPVEGPGCAPLKSLGIASGDLLYVLGSPQQPSPQPAAPNGPALQKPRTSQCTTAVSPQPTTSSQSSMPDQPWDTTAAPQVPCSSPPAGLEVTALPMEASGLSAPDLLWLAGHSVLVDTGFQLTTPIQQDASGAWSIFGLRSLQYVSPAAAGALPCTLKRSSMGNYLTLAAAVDASAAQQEANSQGRMPAVHHVMLSMVEHVSQAAPQAATHMQHQPPASGSGPMRSLKQPHALWRALKDGLALPLLAACCAASGAQQLVGLLALPEDLKARCLMGLQGVDLVTMAQTCREMRALAATEELWRVAFAAELGPIDAAQQTAATANGWRSLFIDAWLQRAEQRRQRAAWLAARNAYNPLRPRTGLYPPPPPLGLGPHGVVGGDYDRLPAIGLHNPQPLGLSGRLGGLGCVNGGVRLGGRAGSAASGGLGRSWG